MKTEKTNTCGNCKAWEGWGETEVLYGEIGTCCLHPPTLQEKEIRRGLTISTHPTTCSEQWCLDHVAMDEKEGDTE